MCTSTNPGIAVESVARISSAPVGSSNARRGPTCSISPSRIRIPASAIVPLGVMALPVCRSVVVMVTAILAETEILTKIKPAQKQNGRSFCSVRLNSYPQRFLLALFGRHVDAAEFQLVAIHAALHGDVVSGVCRHLVLIVDHV